MRYLKFTLDCCELSGETYNLHLHHVIYKSHQGDDLRANILCMHEPLHTRYHAGDPEVKAMVGEFIDTERPDTACYIAEKLGGASALLDWFERHGQTTRSIT